MELTDQQIKEKILSSQIPTQRLNANVPTEEVELPSQGRYYDSDNPLSSGKIILKYPTAKEEDILTSKSLIQKGTVIDMFLQSLIVDKTINYDSILLGDKNALVIASRIMAYGKDYPVELQCSACGEKYETNVDISELQPKEIEKLSEIDSNEFELVLPSSKATVKYKVLTHGDDKNIQTILKQLKKATLIQTPPEMSTRLLSSIVSINGETDRHQIRKFVDTMLSLDSKALRDAIYKMSPDIDMSFLFECQSCGYQERRDMPLGINFFWPSSK